MTGRGFEVTHTSADGASGRSALFSAQSSHLNLNLFYGFGEGIGFAWPRSATIIDAMVLLAVANVSAFAWHSRLFVEQCGSGTPADEPLTARAG